MAPPKSSKMTPREAFLRWKMLWAHKAIACAYGILLFGALFTYQTGDNILGAIIGTVGVFCFWQAMKGVHFFVHTV